VSVAVGLVALYLVSVILFVAWEWSRTPRAAPPEQTSRREAATRHSEIDRRKAA
jgi:hypothetical protein